MSFRDLREMHKLAPAILTIINDYLVAKGLSRASNLPVLKRFRHIMPFPTKPNGDAYKKTVDDTRRHRPQRINTFLRIDDRSPASRRASPPSGIASHIASSRAVTRKALETLESKTSDEQMRDERLKSGTSP